jgi:hypothetical protein
MQSTTELQSQPLISSVIALRKQRQGIWKCVGDGLAGLQVLDWQGQTALGAHEPMRSLFSLQQSHQVLFFFSKSNSQVY